MFNTTHTLVGLALAHTGLNRWNRHAAWTAVIASNLPDIDIAAGLYDMPAYMEYHRGVTHAIAGIPILSLLLAAAMYKFSENFWRTFVVALLAMSTHPLLDYLNTYGLRPFLPFDGRWFYGDALFIIDPIFDGILIAALAAAHFIPSRQRLLAVTGLFAVTLYVGGRLELRNLSRSFLSGFEKAAVSPLMLNPFLWIGLIDSPNEVRVQMIHPFRGIAGEPERVFKTPDSDPAARAAAQSRAGRVFFGFTRFPVTKVERIESGYAVTFFDVRYYDGRTAFAAKINLDSELLVVSETLGFNLRID